MTRAEFLNLIDQYGAACQDAGASWPAKDEVTLWRKIKAAVDKHWPEPELPRTKPAPLDKDWLT